ncbi:MAG: hypothetical protein ACYCQJ_09420 [Nitrososphaerales archaeon]
MPYPSIGGLPPGSMLTGIVDYDIEEVEWNKYELDDGITLCFLALPVVVFSTNQTQNSMPVYTIIWNNMIRVVTDESHTGNPTAPVNPQQASTIPFDVVTPLTTNEPWNVFKLRDGHVLRSRTVASQIRRIRDSYDNLNMPMFGVISQTVIDVQNAEVEGSARRGRLRR